MTRLRRRPIPDSWRRDEERLGWLLALPALGIIALVAVFPIVWTFWESLHADDLRMLTDALSRDERRALRESGGS